MKFSLKPYLSNQWIGKRLLLKSVVSNLFTSIVADNWFKRSLVQILCIRLHWLKRQGSKPYLLPSWTFVQWFFIVLFWRCSVLRSFIRKFNLVERLGLNFNPKKKRQTSTHFFLCNVISGCPFSVRRSVGHHFSRALSASTFSKLILKYRKNSSFLFWPIWLDLGNPALTQSTVATQNGAKKLWNSNLRRSTWIRYIVLLLIDLVKKKD